MPRPRSAFAAVVTVCLLALSACGGADSTSGVPRQATQPVESPSTSETTDEPTEEAAAGHDAGHFAEPKKARPLRAGESRTTIAMPGSYTPSAPYDVGTDDYRCFVLDHELEKDAWLTGTHVLPGNPDVVHHVILFQLPPGQAEAAEAKDAAEEGEGWTCFGGTGLDQFTNVDDASWIGAWAPGGEESVVKPGFGIRLAKGARIVMQVHYNLLAGQEPDTSAAQLRLAPGNRPYQALSTMLLPGPV